MKRTIRLTALTAIAAGALGLPPSADATSLTLTPNSLSFGSQQVGGTSPSQSTTLTLACAGDPDCFLFGASFTPAISTTPGFSQTNTCVGGNATLEVDLLDMSDSCTINASFAPTVPGAVNGTLSTGSGGPTAALTGTGLAPPTTTPAAGGVAGKVNRCKKAKKRAASAKKKKKCKKKKRSG